MATPEGLPQVPDQIPGVPEHHPPGQPDEDVEHQGQGLPGHDPSGGRSTGPLNDFRVRRRGKRGAPPQEPRDPKRGEKERPRFGFQGAHGFPGGVHHVPAARAEPAPDENPLALKPVRVDRHGAATGADEIDGGSTDVPTGAAGAAGIGRGVPTAETVEGTTADGAETGAAGVRGGTETGAVEPETVPGEVEGPATARGGSGTGTVEPAIAPGEVVGAATARGGPLSTGETDGRSKVETAGTGAASGTGGGAVIAGNRPLPTTHVVGKGVHTGDSASRSRAGRQTLGSRSRRPK